MDLRWLTNLRSFSRPTRPCRGIAALDGVRAVAVMAVLAAHAGLPGLQGGFVGVDVFFVLSGFLITSLLLAQRAETGRIALTDFWTARVRRLLPAALAMVTAVLILRPLLPREAVGGLRADAIASALWVSNWRWALQGTDYFGQGGTASPLQHTWSLAVEEQFYLLWPCLLVLVWRGATGMRQLRGRLLVIAASGALVSSAVTLRLTGSATAGRVYFGTDVRAQELLIGACAAAVLQPTWRARAATGRARRSPQAAARPPVPALLTVLGLLGCLAAVHLADGSPDEFRHGLLIAVSLATTALIAGLTLDAGTLVARLLASRPFSVLGRMSYGIYLWHWPLFEVLDGERTGLSGHRLAAVRILVTLVVAHASLVLIEMPARLIRLPRREVLSAGAAGIVMVLAFVGCGNSSPSSTDRSVAAPADGLDRPPALSGTASESAAQPTSRVAKASRTPGRSKPMTIDVFGDSIGWTLASYFPATAGLRLLNRTVLGCGIVQGGPYRYFGQQYRDPAACDTWPQRWRAQVARDRPDEVLLVVGRWETMDRVYRGAWTHLGAADYDTYLSGLLSQAITVLGSNGARVIVSTEPYNRRGEQPDGALFPEDDPARVDDWNSIVRRVLTASSGTRLLDLNRKLCPHGSFTWDVDGVQVRSDGVHLTPQGVQWLTPWLVTELRAARS